MKKCHITYKSSFSLQTKRFSMMLGVVLCVILFRSTLCSNCSYWKIASTNTESVTSFQCSGLTEPVALTVSVERKTLFCNDTTRNESRVERLILAPAPLVCASTTRLSCYGDCSKVWKTVQLLCNWTEKSLVEIKCTFSYLAKKCDLATWGNWISVRNCRQTGNYTRVRQCLDCDNQPIHYTYCGGPNASHIERCVFVENPEQQIDLSTVAIIVPAWVAAVVIMAAIAHRVRKYWREILRTLQEKKLSGDERSDEGHNGREVSKVREQQSAAKSRADQRKLRKKFRDKLVAKNEKQKLVVPYNPHCLAGDPVYTSQQKEKQVSVENPYCVVKEGQQYSGENRQSTVENPYCFAQEPARKANQKNAGGENTYSVAEEPVERKENRSSKLTALASSKGKRSVKYAVVKK